MLTGALALLLAGQPAVAAQPVAAMWQPTIFSGKRGGWPSQPAPQVVDPNSVEPGTPVVCRTGGASIFTGRTNTKQVCTVEEPEELTRAVTPTIFSGRLASRERQQQVATQTQYTQARETYRQARAEASGTSYVPPPPPVVQPKRTIRRPSIFSGRPRAKKSGE